jgi:hypothetical protein
VVGMNPSFGLSGSLRTIRSRCIVSGIGGAGLTSGHPAFRD